MEPVHERSLAASVVELKWRSQSHSDSIDHWMEKRIQPIGCEECSHRQVPARLVGPKAIAVLKLENTLFNEIKNAGRRAACRKRDVIPSAPEARRY